MISRRCLGLLLLLLCGRAAAADCHLLYISGSSYYLDAGRDQGLQVGATVEVVRDGVVVGHLIVRHVASGRAACDLLDGQAPEIGSTLRFSATLPLAGPSSAAPQPRRAPGTWHGRVGARHNAIFSHQASADDLQMPSLDLRLDGRRLAGQFDVEVDARAQRSYRSDDATEGRTRLYRLAMRWKSPQSDWRIGLGRQNEPELATLGVFDGASLLWSPARDFRVGALGGTLPAIDDYGYSTDVVELASFVGWNWDASTVRSAWTVAAVGSYELGEISREYLYLGLRVSGSRWYLRATQDLDVYRDWRADAEGENFGPTSHDINASYRVSTRWTLQGGVDSRRQLRLLRDRETPQTDFDDSFRTGTWAGIRVGLKDAMAVELRGKSRRGGSSGSADTAELRWVRIGLPIEAAWLDTRVAVYGNELVEGVLATLGADWQRQRWTLRGEGGWRDEDAKSAAVGSTGSYWVALDSDWAIGSGWSFVLSWDRYGGGDDERDEFYSGLSYRF